MRSCRLVLLSLLAAVAVAQDDGAREVDPFVTAMQVFEKAKERTAMPGAKGAIYPALEQLTATGDTRTIGPLCAYLNETYGHEQQLLAQSKKRQQQAARAYERMQVLDRELSQLRLKERAGDTSVGPEIEQRVAEARELQQFFGAAIDDVARIERQAAFVVSLRGRIVNSCATILQGSEGEALESGLSQLRRSLDVGDREQALYCVRILRASKQPTAEAHLLQILSQPKVEPGVVRAAINAIVPVMTKRGAQSLLGYWERDPKRFGAAVQHALGLAAKRRLADRAAAAAWVASLPE